MAPLFKVIKAARQIFRPASSPEPEYPPLTSSSTSSPAHTKSHLSNEGNPLLAHSVSSTLASPIPPSLFSALSLTSSASSRSSNPSPCIPSPTVCKSQPRLTPAFFTPLALLGTGTHGCVFLVSSHLTSQRCALKIVNKAQAKKQGMSMNQLLLEQTAMRKAEGAQGVVHLQASWHDKRHFYFLLEVYPNGDLFGLVYENEYTRLPFKSVQFYAAQLLLALEHLHALHIVHHDVKLENVFLDSIGNAVLGDFGLCEVLSSPQALCVAKPGARQSGTLPYFSPEVVKRMFVSYDVDRWAYGVVVYELATGMLPFIDYRPEDVLTRILYAKPQFDASVRPEAKDFLLKVLAKSRSARPSLAEMKKHAFFRGIDWTALAEGEIAPPPVSYKSAVLDAPAADAELTLPKSKPYARGRDPRPSFCYVSPSLVGRLAL